MVDTNKALLLGAGTSVATFVVGVAVGMSARAPGRPQVQPIPQNRIAAMPSASPPSPPPVPAQPVRAQPAPESGQTILSMARLIAGQSGAQRNQSLCSIEASANRSITGAALARNANRFDGQTIVFSGEVFEVQDDPSGGTFLRVGMGGASHINAVLAPLSPPDTVLAGARVRVWGQLAGTFSYTSQAGWQITIPKVIAYAVLPRRDAPECSY